MRALRAMAVVCLALSACFFERDDHGQACESDRECQTDTRCYEGFCIARAPVVGTSCDNGPVERCYDGEKPETAGVGDCKAGQRFCVDGAYTECLGQVLPQEKEVCNGRDDDCNGEVDNVEAAGTCETQLLGACNAGALMCRDGVSFCEPTHQSQTEACNGIDDDCDGAMDEVATGMCYPAGEQGCTADADGTWRCNGLCTTGQTECDGVDEGCVGATTPAEEQCTTGTAFAQDEDCDGAIDESCPCADGAPRECYAGPAGTQGEGRCAAGMQTCADSEWGPCMDQVLPSSETCDNDGEDDDCNGVEDDVPGVGAPCIAFSARGPCRAGTIECDGETTPECIPGEPSEEMECDGIDQDCDGEADDNIDFNSNQTCGACDVQCSSADTCCEGTCLEVAKLETDPDNCGACGRSCGFGRYCCQGDCLSTEGGMADACACTTDCGDKSCCGDRCKDLDTDRGNCGACNRKCGRDQNCVSGVCRDAP